MKDFIMSSLTPFPVGAFEATRPLVDTARLHLAVSLRKLSGVLAQLSRRLRRPTAASVTRGAPLRSQLEFYAEAGAPEGALYLDGVLVGWVSGVNRL
jgi:hypothetical protein